MARSVLDSEQILRLILADESDDDFDSGSSADKEAELERQLGIFDNDSR